MNVLKNNLAKNDIFVISGYGPFIFIRPSKYGLMAYRCSLYAIKCMLIFRVKLPIRYPFHEI
jgi:hypothetical protein